MVGPARGLGGWERHQHQLKRRLVAKFFDKMQLLKLLLLAFVAAQTSPPPIAPIGVIDTSKFNFHQTLYNLEYEFSIYWTLLPAAGNLSIAMILKTNPGTPALKKSWISLAFGRGMLLANGFMVSHNKEVPNNQVELHEHLSLKSYAPPVHVYTFEIAVPQLGFANSTYHGIEFQRPLVTNSPGRSTLKPNAVENFIWAFNPDTGPENGFFTQHSSDHRGAIEIVLGTGLAQKIEVISFATKAVHGFGMLVAWLIILPFGAFYARYFRFVAGWKIVKVVNQTFGILAFLIFFAVIFTTNPRFDKIHSFLGIFVLILTLLQIGFGITALVGMTSTKAERFRSWSRLFHLTTGYSLFAIIIAQVGLGLAILYPLGFQREFWPWILYFVLVGAWIVAFSFAEYYYYSNVRNKDLGYSKVPTAAKALPSVLPKVSKQWTWETLDQDIKSGEMLVVGNGKYVYDISQWIQSHPGGQLILRSVNGTDISNDYFHEAGFDAKEFLPRESAPVRNSLGAQRLVGGLSRADMISIKKKQNSISSASNISAPVSAASFEKSDWDSIIRARRTHVHTRLAIQKLATLIVGEIVPSRNLQGSSNTIMTEGFGLPFDAYEYRRYALTKIEQKSPPGATHPFVLLRFCLLYPYDSRDNQPLHFKTGECVEIQARIGGGQIISRYYTPISGDLNAFEILVKSKPNGKMSQLLLESKKGERQFKIRGPFGNPIIRGISPIGGADEYDTIYCFCGGSGITPFLQLIDRLILPTRIPLIVNIFDLGWTAL